MAKWWKAVLIVGLAGAAAMAAGAWRVSEAVPLFSEGDPQFAAPPNIANGKLIFDAGDCASCHAAPGQSNPLGLGGGIALASSFGTFRPPNISPDPVDGIGNWSAVDLANAMIAGVSPRHEHYYPAFPYTSFTGMKPRDVVDLFGYLQTLPKVSGRAPPHHPAILFRIRRSMGLWKLLFFRPGSSEASLNGDPVHDRGAYLVESVSHCAECHSTRNLFGAVRKATRFAGSIDPQGSGFVPNITPRRVGKWSEEDIATMLKTGATPDHGRVGSSMSGVVSNTAMLPEGDRKAIARYINMLLPIATPHP